MNLSDVFAALRDKGARNYDMEMALQEQMAAEGCGIQRQDWTAAVDAGLHHDVAGAVLAVLDVADTAIGASLDPDFAPAEKIAQLVVSALDTPADEGARKQAREAANLARLAAAALERYAAG